jgi:hypothetical protein
VKGCGAGVIRVERSWDAVAAGPVTEDLPLEHEIELKAA